MRIIRRTPHYLYGVTFVTGQGAVDKLSSMPQAHILRFSGTGSSFSVQNYKKQYWCIENFAYESPAAYKTTSYDLTLKEASGSAAKFKLVDNGKMQSTAGVYLCTNGYSVQAGPNYFGNPIHFYQFSDYTINLRLSMLDALPYLIDNSEGRFTDADAYNDLIAAMKAAVEAYSVHYDTVESALSAETKTELQNLNTDLQNAITAVKASDTGDRLAALRDNINAAYWPYAEQIMCPKTNIKAGYYMILAMGEKGETAVNSDALPNGWVQDGDAHIFYEHLDVTQDYSVTQLGSDGVSRGVNAARPDNQVPIVNLSGTYDKFTLQHYNGLYWSMTNNTHWHDANNPSPTTWGDFQLSTSPTTFWLENDANNGVDGVSFQIYHTVNSNTNIIYANGYTFRTKLKPSSTTGSGYNLDFYRFNEEALDLRLALHEGLSYLVEDYGTRFDKDAFNALRNKLNEVYYTFDSVYDVRGMAPSNMTDAKKRDYKKLTEEVLNAIAAVQRTDNEAPDYIDIPIEVLDFRGDGLLFENAAVTPYSLSIGGAKASYPDGFPGYDSGGAAAGLTTGTLVDGNVVFTKATVDYVAKHLYSQTALVTPANQMNRIFYDLIKSGTLTYSADDYAKIKDKCQPKVEGGKLPWGEVKTYHDLAYYLLSHMWKESEDILDTETLPNGSSYDTTYNMLIPELSTMRLYKGSNGKYSFLSNKMSSAADGYIQNVTDKALTIRRFDPMFQPLNNKGFESTSLYGTATEGASDNANNYLFTVHAYGAFVYTESANLNFSFSGDDDVYFYINGTRVCDIGGMHIAVSKSVNLNDYAAALGLKDGQICRFDMFHAERHTSGSNLNFTTNIELMDEDVITEKTQYDPETDQTLMDGAVVAPEKEIAYAFSLLNRRSAPVKYVQFTDTKIATTLDGKNLKMSLNEDTELSDLSITYTTYDIGTGKLCTNTPTVYDDYSYFSDMIRQAVENTTSAVPLPSGAYTYVPKAEEELISLLNTGIPASCKLTIRGFRHIMPNTKSEFTNSLTSVCIPIQYKLTSDGTSEVIELAPITGSASCLCVTMDVDMVSAEDPYAVVMDYGKPAQMDLLKIAGTLSADSSITLTYVGSTFNGNHGTIKATIPINLTFTTEGQVTETDTYRYAMIAPNTLRFTPKEIMDEAYTFYAVYRITSSSIANFTPCYIMKAVSFLPATTVYYETDFDKPIYTEHNKNCLLIDFGTNDTTQWETGARMTASKTNGVFKGTVTGNDPYIKMTAASSTFNYVPKEGDVVKMRIKADKGIGSGHQIFLLTTANMTANETYNTYEVSGTPDGTWQTITLPFRNKDKVIGCTIKGIRIDPIAYYNSGASGNFEIDWVYIGPEDGFDEPLRLDFDSSDTTVWGTEGSNNATAVKENGVLKGQVNGTDPFIRMSAASCTLKYIVKPADVVKVRIKSDPCIGEDLQVFFMTDTNSSPAGGVSTSIAEYAPNGQWQTITLNLLDGLVGKQIRGLRIDPTGDGGSINTYQSPGNFEIDWIYIGPENGDAFRFTATSAEHPWEIQGWADSAKAHSKLSTEAATYGYDPSYTDDTTISNESIAHVVGVGVPRMNPDASINYEASATYTEASFHFTGTGFDIISRTGPDQGALRALIYRQSDGSYVKSVSVINKGTSTLYQIPVISVTDLKHDDYTVKIFVNAPYTNADYPALNRGGEFYFDAVRIYHPIDTNATDADSAYIYSMYQLHGEADPTFKEVRDILIDAGSFNANGTMDGVVYLNATAKDNVEFDDENGSLEPEVAEYKEIGPNNEVYLRNSNAIAFKLEVDGQIPASVDIGVKSVDGTPVTLCSAVSTAAPTAVPTGNAVNITSCTAQYYPLTVSGWETDGDGKHFIYIALQNTGSGILSVTNVKFGNGTAASKQAFAFKIDRQMINSLGLLGSAIRDAALDFAMNISAGADMKVAYTIKAETVAAYERFYLKVSKSVAGGEAVSTTYDLSNLTVTNDPTTGEAYMYTAIFDGINAKEMGDVFEATLYAVDADGKLYCSTTNASSIKSYLLEKLNDESAIDALKTMAVDMLNYGAAAQLHFAYDTENLVNADLTDEQKAYATSELPEAVDSSATDGEGVALRTSVSVKEKVYLNLTATYTPTDASALKAVICDAKGNVIAELPVTVKNNVLCQASYGEVGAKQMRQLLTATMYEGDKAVSTTITWSVESYVAATRANANATATQIAMVNAMLTYGDAVAAYLTASGQ